MQYANNTAICPHSEDGLQSYTDNFTKSYEKMGLELNIRKTHVLLQKAPCENGEQPDIKIHDEM